MTTSARPHGACACADCWQRPDAPARVWVLRAISACEGGIRLQGVNLSIAPDDPNRRFSWAFTGGIAVLADPRYDATNATIDAGALAFLERMNTSQPIRS